jgi:hypothetical protein
MTEPRERLPTADGELWSLVEAVVDGTAGVAEQARLEARLRAEPEARLFYVAYLDLHAHLQWRTRGGSAARPSPQPKGRPALRAPRVALWVAASLALAAGLLLLLPSRHGPEEGEPPDLPEAPAGSVAVLIDKSDTVWEKDTTVPTGTGSALPPGRLKLKEGVVEIAFHGGGEVVLEGPADFDVRAADQAFLHRGKLLAHVPDGARAVRIGTPGMVVTDHGGECGMLTDESGLTEVHVFEGHVGAGPTNRQGEPLPGMPLAEKTGARVEAAGRNLTAVPLNEQAFARLRPEIRVADASVRGGQFAERNFGTAPRLVVKNSIADYTWDTYLRFDLSGIKGKVSEATVRLVPVYVGQPIVNAVALVADNRWGETTITWDTKPPSEPAFARWTVQEGKAVEFDVTPQVQAALAGDKKLSLRVFAPERRRGSAFVEYGSRRGDAESRPQLLVTVVP